MRRVLPGLLAIAAFYADGRGSHGLAFDALLGAIPFAAGAAIMATGRGQWRAAVRAPVRPVR